MRIWSFLGRTLVAVALGEPAPTEGLTEFFVKQKSLEEAESSCGLYAPSPNPRATPLQPSCDLAVTFPLIKPLKSPKQLY